MTYFLTTSIKTLSQGFSIPISYVTVWQHQKWEMEQFKHRNPKKFIAMLWKTSLDCSRKGGRKKWKKQLKKLNNLKRALDFMRVSLWSFIIINAQRHMKWDKRGWWCWIRTQKWICLWRNLHQRTRKQPFNKRRTWNHKVNVSGWKGGAVYNELLDLTIFFAWFWKINLHILESFNPLSWFLSM